MFITITIKTLLVICLLSTLIITSDSNVIPAAIIRRHTVTYKDLDTSSSKPIEHPVIYVPSSMMNLFVHFKTKSSQVHLKHEHKGNAGQTQHTVSHDEPHYLKHEVQKPVIQEIREMIIPYRKVIQQIKPVVEEVKTLVATGVPKSQVYMNFGETPKGLQNYAKTQTNDQNYDFVQNINHDIDSQYISPDNNPVPNHNSMETLIRNPKLLKNTLYDLSPIYGVKPSVPQLSDYLIDSSPTKKEVPKIEDQSYYGVSSPVVYGVTSDVQQNSGTPDYSGYTVNAIHETPVQYNVQNSGYNEGIVTSTDYKNNDYGQSQSLNYQDKNNNYQDNKNNVQMYDLVENVVPEYYLNYIDPKNNINSNAYYSDVNLGYESDSRHETDSDYMTKNVVNSQYSNQYSGDLITSDGSALNDPSAVVPLFGPFSEVPITKATTLASLAQLVSALPYQYTYENSISNTRNS